jgi:LuxR family maltose regulon positive regulatory protein
MSTTTPTVAAHWAYDPARPGAAIRLDTPAWIAWLEDVATTRFAYPLFDPTKGYIVGVMTVRKERRRRGGAYWAAYRRCGRRLRKVYVGRASAVTQARLEVLASGLLAVAGSAAPAR